MITYKQLRKIDAVIFDMDGLLLDTEQVSKELWTKACREYSINLPDEVFNKMIGTNKEACKKMLFGEYGEAFPYDAIDARYRELSGEYYRNNNAPIKEGADALLDVLTRMGIKRALATSTSRPKAEMLLTKAGLLCKFTATVFGDMVKASKPEPDIFIKAAEMLDVEIGGCVVLEDSMNGIRAAHAAGAMPVMVPDMLQPTAEITEMLYIKCDSLNDIIKIITT